eukprot:CAMPEP_0180683486 /NCGR_PEP_ID=MMETSP1037_2-20121125/71196_1 /TAXON_ID=632150 /ORGANISM="Azadinium spinosum, Strain 3D9" /LENGTH=46 /DNA_ID= /DNA_START= /DNA_END= /DNA_ORIENTATION=
MDIEAWSGPPHVCSGCAYGLRRTDCLRSPCEPAAGPAPPKVTKTYE